MTTPAAGPRVSPAGPAPCEAARAISIETLPTTPALVCARCGATIRAGASPALEVWCPRRARAEGVAGSALDTLTLAPEDAPAGEAPRTLGRWRLHDLLGQGGAGVVYRAWDTLLDRAVALKVLPGGVLAGPNAVARFHREARAAGQLDVPGVVRVLDVGGTPDGALWIAMELVEGPSLADVRADGPLSPARAARFVRAVAETLAVVHRAGLAHRDVKPSNIVLDPRGRPILVDFGLAVPLDGESDLTRGPVGTPAFMAPEQRRGEPGLDWRLVDVYALGRVLDALLAARPPDLAAVIDVATAEAPGDRYPSAEALAADLGAWLDGRPVSVRRAGAWRRARLFARRHRRRLLAGALAAAVLLAAGGAAWGVRRVRARAARTDRERVLQEQLDHLLPQVARTDAAGGDGEALLLGFVDDPTNARTAARARAWAGHAEALDAAGDGAGAREAWA
ncbi:MAG: serine/threonine-protein kinase, partial [Pseudomonadota bacterium]|nr:serine/threonine-protein kinase [Pseudomonadota bacterium]